MRLIPTRAHGVLDYLVGLILIAAPWLLHFSDDRAATWVPVVLGVGALAYSLCTNYELGLFKVLPMRTHLRIDLASGVLLLLSPFIFGFWHRIVWPHVVFGLIEIGAALMTNPVVGMGALPERNTGASTAGGMGRI